VSFEYQNNFWLNSFKYQMSCYSFTPTHHLSHAEGVVRRNKKSIYDFFWFLPRICLCPIGGLEGQSQKAHGRRTFSTQPALKIPSHWLNDKLLGAESLYYKLIIIQLIKTFHCFYGIKMSITLFTTARQSTSILSKWTPVHTMTLYFKVKLNIIMVLHFRFSWRRK
jgi:hypothetical protein